MNDEKNPVKKGYSTAELDKLFQKLKPINANLTTARPIEGSLTGRRRLGRS